MFGPFGLVAPKNFRIISLSNILTMNVADEGYSKNASCALNKLSTFYFLLRYDWLSSISVSNSTLDILGHFYNSTV